MSWLKKAIRIYNNDGTVVETDNSNVNTKKLSPWINDRFLSFEKAREFVRSLKLKNAAEWQGYCRSGQKPDNIPSGAWDVYKDQWNGMGDWLGTGNIRKGWKGWTDKEKNIKEPFLPFEEAREFVRSLKLNNFTEWQNYCRSGQRPTNIPTTPSITYKGQFKGLGDWLGTGNTNNHNRTFLSFEQAKEFVHNLGLQTLVQWQKYCVHGEKPDNIPACPGRIYKDQWKGWGDWLSTGRVATQDKKFQSFDNARAFARTLKLNNSVEWAKWAKNKPDSIPRRPDFLYKDQWKGWKDWLGITR